MTLKVIKLSGSLGRRFGVFHKMAVDSYPEAIRALSSQVEGFKDYMQSEVGSRMKYAVFVDGKNVGQHDEKSWKCAREVRIIPVPTGSKSGGLFNVVFGAVIMATAFITGGASLAAMGAFASSAFMMGGAIALGGCHANDFAAAGRNETAKPISRKQAFLRFRRCSKYHGGRLSGSFAIWI